MRTVLISGASVAGLTAAYWLRRRGFAPTVVERAPALRPGGQAVDVRGVALDVLERMDLLEEARALRTRMRGMSMVDGEGNEQWRSTEVALSSGRLDGEDIELLRDDLTRLLHERVRDEAEDAFETEFVFGDSLTALTVDADGAHAEFAHGAPRTFDLVVGADGLRSTTRRLAFGPEGDFLHHLGQHVAVFSSENFLKLEDWQVWMQHEGSGYCVYPAPGNAELRTTIGFTSEGPEEYDHRDTGAQKALLAERLGHLGGDVPRLLEVMREAPDFYFDAMAQVRMESWVRGRAALVGDAGYCPSPLSGQGSSLALVGAYVLADELGKEGAEGTEGDLAAGLARYDARMRPFVAVNQALATENPGRGASEESVERAKNALDLGPLS
ncbi:FAD-dependent monooxygenase [Streptomyces sp. NPDC048172]|uniref:FAD-dependent monooxygenase n=1 Tax=Streptomyces sp. NPDC048172 TaxID=3365505 RepID=UPI00371E202B